MPVHRGRDSRGPYYQWGGAKRYYTANHAPSRARAKAKAALQGRAIEAWRHARSR